MLPEPILFCLKLQYIPDFILIWVQRILDSLKPPILIFEITYELEFFNLASSLISL